MQASSTAWSHRHGTSIRFCSSRPTAYSVASASPLPERWVRTGQASPARFGLVSTTHRRSAGDGPRPLSSSSLLEFAARENGCGWERDRTAPWTVDSVPIFSGERLVQTSRDKLRPKRPSCYLDAAISTRGLPDALGHCESGTRSTVRTAACLGLDWRGPRHEQSPVVRDREVVSGTLPSIFHDPCSSSHTPPRPG